jgi:hypothetical protein
VAKKVANARSDSSRAAQCKTGGSTFLFGPVILRGGMFDSIPVVVVQIFISSSNKVFFSLKYRIFSYDNDLDRYAVPNLGANVEFQDVEKKSSQ